MLAHSSAAAGADLIPCALVDQQETLSGTALALYQALQATARRAAVARAYVPTVTHVTVHIPLETVARAVGKHRVTVWRALPKLRALGLVDARPHKTTALGGRTVNSGTLWAVRLNPNEGTAAKLTHEELQHEWRDLDRDRRRGRTAYQEGMQQSKELPVEGFNLELLLAWAVAPQPTQTPLNNDCCGGARADLEAVLDVADVPTEARGEMVDTAARALSGALGDAGGLMFYRWLLWQLLRLQDRTGAAPFYQVYLAAQRARADRTEGFGRKPGALFVSRLKQAPWWDELTRASGRVGVRPNPPEPGPA